MSKRDFHDPTIHLGNYLMHYTYFDGTRGVREHQKKLPELDLPPELKIGTFFPVVHANTMMSFAIDMVSATEVYPDGPEKCTLVTSNLVPKSTAELPDFKEIFAQYMANGDVVRNEDVIACRAPAARPQLALQRPRLLHAAGQAGPRLQSVDPRSRRRQCRAVGLMGKVDRLTIDSATVSMAGRRPVVRPSPRAVSARATRPAPARPSTRWPR